MPTYEYECQHCGPMEIYQSIKDDTLKACPQCGSKRFRKLISRGGGVIFKGEGFWETDYNRSESYRQQSKQDAGGSAGTSEGSGQAAGSAAPAAAPAASTDAKPAAAKPAANKAASAQQASPPASSSGR